MQESAARDRMRSMSELTVAIRSTASQARTDLLELFSRRWAGPVAFSNTDVSLCSAHPLCGPLSSSDDDGKQKNAGMWREMIILVAHRNGQYFDLLCIWSRPNNFLEYSGEMKLEYMRMSFTWVLVTQLSHKVDTGHSPFWFLKRKTHLTHHRRNEAEGKGAFAPINGTKMQNVRMLPDWPVHSVLKTLHSPGSNTSLSRLPDPSRQSSASQLPTQHSMGFSLKKKKKKEFLAWHDWPLA
ncbi:hypothetical protein QQF64_012336 [Cirrhinus molitorella]|uniref:Uncharacterized protein n=1 Tax=Cirrhinus molitorella TaxID=172907 RepID=A0ABR3LV70_9TELE